MLRQEGDIQARASPGYHSKAIGPRHTNECLVNYSALKVRKLFTE